MSERVIASANYPLGKISKMRSVILIIGSSVFVLLSAAAIFLSNITAPDLFQNSVSIDVSGITVAESKKLDVTLTSVGEIPRLMKMRCIHSDRNPFHWSMDHCIWIDTLFLHVAQPVLGHIKSIIVKVGPVSRTFSGAEIVSWPRVKSGTWVFPQSSPEIVSLKMPRVSAGQLQGINTPSFAELGKNAMLHALVFFLFCLFFIFIAFRFVARPVGHDFLKRALNLPLPDKGGELERLAFSREIGPFFCGLLAVCVGLTALYAMKPYPFTQDDSFSQFLPVILRSAETLASGHFPVWNPYQLLGAPTATVGTYALTYPPIYLAYWAAHSILHNDNATIEIFCVFHLLLGYVVTFFALRLFGIKSILAASGAMCWILSGWFLVGGRSQCNFTPYAVFLPLLIALTNQWGRAPVGFGWVAFSGITAGVLFHAGHAEFWFYSIGFCSLAICLMMAGGGIPLSRLVYAASAFLVSLAVASPLLWLQKWETDGIQRVAGTGWPSDVMDMLFPFVGLCSSTTKLGSVDYQYFPEIFYAGTVFFACGIFILSLCVSALIFCPRAIELKQLAKNQWLLLGGLAFIMSLGAPAVLWSVVSFLPIFNRFRWPIKYTSYLHIFFIFGAGLVLERLLPRRAKPIIFAATAALMLFHVTQCRSSLYDFAERPYPVLPIAMQKLFTKENPGRIYCIAPVRSAYPGFFQGLVMNFPTVCKIFSYQGYDTFVGAKDEYVRTLKEMEADPVKTAQAYGIEWILWSELERYPKLSNPSQTFLELCSVGNVDAAGTIRREAKIVYQTADLKIYHLSRREPLVFVSDPILKSLSFSADQSGLSIDTSALDPDTTITANFICWPWMTAEAGGKRLAIKPDSWNRIQVKLTERSPQTHIFYRPPWALSCSLGLALLVAAAVTGMVAHLVQVRESKRAEKDKNR